MKRVFEWDVLEELVLAGGRLHSLGGGPESWWGRWRSATTAVSRWRWSGAIPERRMEHLEELGRAESPACWMLCGYASGYASLCLDSKVYFVEQACRAFR